jgi:hypothetical protein
VSRREWPPGEGGGPERLAGSQGPTATTITPTADQGADNPNTTATGRQHGGRGAELLAQLRRRHEASRRMAPLPHSGRRDPLTPRERADGWAR